MSISLRNRVCEHFIGNELATATAISTCEIEHGRRTVVIDSLKGNLKPFYNALSHWGLRHSQVSEFKVARADGTYSVQRSLSVSGPAQFLDRLSECACFSKWIFGEVGSRTGQQSKIT